MMLYSKEILRLAKVQFPNGPSFTVTHSCRQHNPICGDRVEWKLQVEQERVVAVWCSAKGCVLCKASTAVLMENLRGQQIVEVEGRLQKFIEDIHTFIQDQSVSGRDVNVFAGVATAPARKECVLLPWTAMQKMLGSSET